MVISVDVLVPGSDYAGCIVRVSLPASSLSDAVEKGKHLCRLHDVGAFRVKSGRMASTFTAAGRFVDTGLLPKGGN